MQYCNSIHIRHKMRKNIIHYEAWSWMDKLLWNGWMDTFHCGSTSVVFTAALCYHNATLLQGFKCSVLQISSIQHQCNNWKCQRIYKQYHQVQIGISAHPSFNNITPGVTSLCALLCLSPLCIFHAILAPSLLFSSTARQTRHQSAWFNGRWNTERTSLH